MIDHSLHPTGHMPRIILHLWGFLCIRDAGCRDNIITGIMTLIHSVSWLLSLNAILWIIWLSAATQHSTKLILLPHNYYFHFKAVGSWESINGVAVMQGNSHFIFLSPISKKTVLWSLFLSRIVACKQVLYFEWQAKRAMRECASKQQLHGAPVFSAPCSWVLLLCSFSQHPSNGELAHRLLSWSRHKTANTKVGMKVVILSIQHHF